MLLLLVLPWGLFLHPAVGTAAHGPARRALEALTACGAAGGVLHLPLLLEQIWENQRAASWFSQWVTRCCRGGQGKLRARAGLGALLEVQRARHSCGWDQFRELRVPSLPGSEMGCRCCCLTFVLQVAPVWLWQGTGRWPNGFRCAWLWVGPAHLGQPTGGFRESQPLPGWPWKPAVSWLPAEGAAGSSQCAGAPNRCSQTGWGT